MQSDEVARPKSPLEQFKEAVHTGDAVALRSVLTRHAEVRSKLDAPVFSFDAPALVAVSEQHLEVIDVLLEFGADPNRKSSWWAGGFHPLYGKRGVAAVHLIAAGAVPDACAAANLDRLDLLSEMLASDASRARERGGDGQTPLHFARSRAVVDLLLNAGADIDARDVDHRATAAEWMVGDADRRDLAKYLVERGATADIFLAAALGFIQRARTLLESNASLLKLRTGQGPYAEKHPSSYHIYQWTLGANLTPLQVAAKFEQRETLAVMSEFASPQERLLLACHDGNRAAAQVFVAAQPDIVAQLGPVDRRALTEAAWMGNARAVELMLELGFDPSLPTGSGAARGNALHCAAWQGSVDCVRALLAHERGRALLESRDPSFGGTPLGWCEHGSVNCSNPNANHAEVARLLIAAGAKPDRE